MSKKHGIKHYRLIFVCLVLSTLSWFVVRMAKSYTQTYPLTIEFVNLPKGKEISYQSDTTVIVEVNGKGMFLLALELKRKQISIDYNSVTTPSQRKSSHTAIQARQVKDYLIEHKNFPQSTVILDPKRITLELKNEKWKVKSEVMK